MEVPVGFLQKLWSFISLLPFFFLLLLLGLVKGACHQIQNRSFGTTRLASWLWISISVSAATIGPVVVCIILFGNSSVILGLWIEHFIWTYYCVAKTKRLGLVLKMLIIICLPVPLVLWPVAGIAGSLLGGIGYGVFIPLLATFEAVGEGVTDKFYHCFIDGCWSTIEGSCTVVRDFTDFCFHSYFSFMDEVSEKVPADEKPVDIKLLKLQGCLLVSLIGAPVDMLLVAIVSLWESPYMLFRGWKRLLEDLVGREGPFLETVCVPFAAIAIILWPIAVGGAVISAIFAGFFLGLYGGVIVHQENSVKMGLAYIISAVSLFDEYANDLLYLQEGSCLPRLKYRKNMAPPSNQRRSSIDGRDSWNGREGSKLVSERSLTLKRAVHQFNPIQVWDWLFKSYKVNGRILLQGGLIDIKDIERCIMKGDCKKLGIKLPAWSILQCLLASAKSDSLGLIIYEVELTRTNWPRGKVFEWFVGPLFIIKEQIKGLNISQEEELCLRKLVMEGKNEEPDDWNDVEFPSSDKVRRAQLQAIIRRLQGIVASMSRLPTFRRRFKDLVKVLYLEAIKSGASAKHIGEILMSDPSAGSGSMEGANDANGDTTGSTRGNRTFDEGNIV